jgi:hypothetical protein
LLINFDFWFHESPDNHLADQSSGELKSREYVDYLDGRADPCSSTSSE